MANIGYIQLNRICNQACLFCSNPDTGATLSFAEFKTKVNDFKQRNYQGVILTGGEPTLIDWLDLAISYCQQRNLAVRLITNGQKTADLAYLTNLQQAGLSLVHVSLYSYKPQVQNYLSQNKQSYTNIINTLKNTQKLKLTTNLNTVINKYNADHLDKTIYFILKSFPIINHFVFNNLDPYMNRASENKQTIPKLKDFEHSLNKALRLLQQNSKTFRVERVPLCYMPDFAQYSTETRKIVKNEERMVHFLDQKGLVKQQGESFKYKQADICRRCNLNAICAGLYSLNDYYFANELKPVKHLTKEDIINQI